MTGAPDCFRGGAVDLHPGLTAGEAFGRIVRGCLDHFQPNRRLLLDGREGEALHQARVALRRLRSAFSVFRPLLVTETLIDLGDRLRGLAAATDEARDIDVLLAGATAGGPIALGLKAAQTRAYRQLRADLAGPRAQALLASLDAGIASGAWLAPDLADRPAEAFAADLLSRLHRRLLRHARGLDHAGDEARHELRKDAKRLRYAAEFFAPMFGKAWAQRQQKRYLAALARLQDCLGALNDQATAPLLLKRLGLAGVEGADRLCAHKKPKPILRKASRAVEAMACGKPFWR